MHVYSEMGKSYLNHMLWPYEFEAETIELFLFCKVTLYLQSTFGDVSHLRDVPQKLQIPKALCHIKAYRAGYHTIPKLWKFNKVSNFSQLSNVSIQIIIQVPTSQGKFVCMPSNLNSSQFDIIQTIKNMSGIFNFQTFFLSDFSMFSILF